MLAAKVSGLIHTIPKNSLWIRCSGNSANKNHEVAANKPFGIVKTSFSTVEKKLDKGMVICYATRSPVLYLADTGPIVAAICKTLNSIVANATAVLIRQPRAEATDLSSRQLDY